jgi:mono/diheme cytochrome c family protein
VLLAGGTLALVAVLAQGYLGGRMTYDQGVGVDAGGEFAQTATGAKALEADFAHGGPLADAGHRAFSRSGLGCASCHGDQAQGLRGPSLSGGVDLDEFRRAHGAGLFPPTVVTDRDFKAINAWLQSLPRRRGRRDRAGKPVERQRRLGRGRERAAARRRMSSLPPIRG